MTRLNLAHFWTLVDSRTLPVPRRHVVSAVGVLEGRCGVADSWESCCQRFRGTFHCSQVATLQPCLVGVKRFPLQRSNCHKE